MKFLLRIGPLPFSTEWILILVIGLLCSLPFIYWTVRRKSLTLPAALGACVLGITVGLSVGALWLLPLFFFFLSSYVFGKLSDGAEDGETRALIQVISNGGVYLVLAMLATWTQSSVYLLLMAVSISIATADTWASEIGYYFKGSTYDIWRLKILQPGVSGGISWQGTLAGALGSLSIAGLVLFLLPRWATGYTFGVVSIFGLVGMFIDSLLGALFQARFVGQEDWSISDEEQPGDQLYSGFRFFNNDHVNLASNILGTVLAYLFYAN